MRYCTSFRKDKTEGLSLAVTYIGIEKFQFPFTSNLSLISGCLCLPLTSRTQQQTRYNYAYRPTHWRCREYTTSHRLVMSSPAPREENSVTERNKKWKAYVLISISSLINFVSIADVYNIDTPSHFFQGIDVKADIMFGFVTFLLSLFIL